MRRIELDPVRFSESSLLVGPANIARESRLLRPLVVLGAIGPHGERLALFRVQSQRDLVEHVDIRQQARSGRGYRFRRWPNRGQRRKSVYR